MKSDIDIFKPSFRRNPATLYNEFQRKMDKTLNRLFDDFDMSAENIPSAFESFQPACDIEENDSYYLVKFDVPGVRKEDIKVQMSGDTLSVSGERREENTEKKGKSRWTETRYGSFERSFTLPMKVDVDEIEASYEDGVLNVYVPKAEAAERKEIKVGEGKGFIKNLFGKKTDKEIPKEMPKGAQKEKGQSETQKVPLQ